MGLGKWVMRKDLGYWLITFVRGLVAIGASCFIIFVPNIAHSVLFLPVAVAMTIAGLAAYLIIDGTLVLASSVMATSGFTRFALAAQGCAGFGIGGLLLWRFLPQARMESFLPLAALQALITATGEFAAASHPRSGSTFHRDYTVTVLAVVCGCAYLLLGILVPNLTRSRIAWLMFAYLATFGLSQCVTAARMINGSENASAPTCTPI